ncbi:MAG: hypothetical protein U0556_11670 [Dehalococcoidia bacterium]
MPTGQSVDLKPPSGWIFLLRLLAWEHVLFGTLSLLGGALLLVAPPEEAPPIYFAPLYLAAGAGLVLAGAGMLSYRTWGRTLSLALAVLIGGLSLLPFVLGLARIGPPMVSPDPLPMVHALLTVGLLTRSHVRRAFGL